MGNKHPHIIAGPRKPRKNAKNDDNINDLANIDDNIRKTCENDVTCDTTGAESRIVPRLVNKRQEPIPEEIAHARRVLLQCCDDSACQTKAHFDGILETL